MRVISIVLALLVVVGGGTWYAVSQHNKPLTNKEYQALPITDQFEKAPKGNYLHLMKNDSTLYRTTWSKKQIKDYFDRDYGHSKAFDNGTTAAKTKLGTNHLFNDKVLMDSDKGFGEIGQIYDVQLSNNKFSKIEDAEDKSFNWYFSSARDAQKDTDVSSSVQHIVR